MQSETMKFDPAAVSGEIDMELTARGGGSMRIRIDSGTGRIIG